MRYFRKAARAEARSLRCLVLEPQLTMLPQIDGNGLMHMGGFFPSAPSQINFELVYAPVGGRWRIFGVSVGVGPSSPVAPNPPPVVHPPTKPVKTEPIKPKRKPHPIKPMAEPPAASGRDQQPSPRD
jgi:hypothetical protein